MLCELKHEIENCRSAALAFCLATYGYPYEQCFAQNTWDRRVDEMSRFALISTLLRGMALFPRRLLATALNRGGVWLVIFVLSAFVSSGFADVITINGVITQAVSDGTGPAVNNPALNNIIDGDAFTVTLAFPGSIAGVSLTPYNLSGGTLHFLDTTQGVGETNFALISLSITTGGANLDNFSLLGCLAGTDCGSDFLTANFQIQDSAIHDQNVAVTPLDQPHPLDLLEDGGLTDIHGVPTIYSYTSTSTAPVPEPSTMLLLGSALAAVGAVHRRKSKQR